ncbi:hypothetical protein Tco_0618847 [Tanacetum coccineum]
MKGIRRSDEGRNAIGEKYWEWWEEEDACLGFLALNGESIMCLLLWFPTQPATTEISGDNGSNLEDFFIVLTREEADIIIPIMAVEEGPLMMLESGPNIIKEDFSNDLDGQHSTDENKPYHNILRWHIMRLKWGYVISIGQICTNVWLKQEMVFPKEEYEILVSHGSRY